MGGSRTVRFFKRRIDGAQGISSSDPIELSEEQLRREIGCYFADVCAFLALVKAMRVNEFLYWQE